MLCSKIVVLVRVTTIYVKAGSPTVEYYRCALSTLELLTVKHGVSDVSGSHFSSCNIDDVLDFVSTV